MDFIGLTSGGKDSIYSIYKLIKNGNNLIALLYMESNEIYTDSYMYQTVGSEALRYNAECMDIPLHIYPIKNTAKNIELEYEETIEDEIEDLYFAILDMKKKYAFTGVSSGAILSKYQKNRVENICQRLDLISLSPLWNLDQKNLLNEMIENGMKAVIVKVATPALKKECINMEISGIQNVLSENQCGEGGEYETIVIDCPIFKKKIIIKDYSVEVHPEEIEKRQITFYMKINKIELKEK
ncbi:diphthine--ammonia ligase [Hamiltosporidium magnivora]|uniref:Diphthine--ammonia ligase n=1 Tax=Hamiltosporidium magnivora TaxID=148818 RepID=A0A4Q9LIK2_9MICR|nr:diphthine--ammonia ligase [Hamiltosporidium magnivora]